MASFQLQPFTESIQFDRHIYFLKRQMSYLRIHRIGKWKRDITLQKSTAIFCIDPWKLLYCISCEIKINMCITVYLFLIWRGREVNLKYPKRLILCWKQNLTWKKPIYHWIVTQRIRPNGTMSFWYQAALHHNCYAFVALNR